MGDEYNINKDTLYRTVTECFGYQQHVVSSSWQCALVLHYFHCNRVLSQKLYVITDSNTIRFWLDIAWLILVLKDQDVIQDSPFCDIRSRQRSDNEVLYIGPRLHLQGCVHRIQKSLAIFVQMLSLILIPCTFICKKQFLLEFFNLLLGHTKYWYSS